MYRLYHCLLLLQLALIGVTFPTSLTASPPLISPNINIMLGSAETQILGKPPVAFNDRVWLMRFSPDGQRIFTVTDQVCAVDWRKKIPQVIWEPSGDETLTRASFAPDCTLFARLNQGEKVHLHDASTGKVLHTFEHRAAGSMAIAWSANNELIAYGGNKRVMIHNARSGALVREIPHGRTDVIAIAFSPDGMLLVAGSRQDEHEDGLLMLHHLDGQSPPIRLPGNATGSSEMRLAFAPDSKSLAVLCNIDKRETLYLWDLVESKIIRQQSAFKFDNDITYSPDGSLIAACGLNNLVIQDARTGREVFRHQGESINTHIWSLAFSADGHTLAAGIENRIKLWDTRTWQQIDPDPDLSTPVSALAFSHDGRHLVTGLLNGDVLLWDWQTKTPVWKNPATPDQWHIESVAIDPSNTMIAFNQSPRISGGQRVSILDLATGKSLPPPSLPPTVDGNILFLADRKTALIADANGSLIQWDIATGLPLKTIAIPFLGKLHCDTWRAPVIYRDASDPDLIWWTCGFLSGAYNLKTDTESFTFDGGRAPGDAAPIPPRSHEFVTSGDSIWTLPDARGVRSGEVGYPTARHPFGNLLFMGHGNKISIFDFLSESIIRQFSLGSGEIKVLTLTPDGKTLVAATTGGLYYCPLLPSSMPATNSSEVLWQIMGSENHWQAYLAAWTLARQPGAIEFLIRKLPPAEEPTPAELRVIQTLLKDGNHEIRQTGARMLLDLGLPLAQETYATLRKSGIPSSLPTDLHPDSLAIHGYSDAPPIPLLTPLSDHRRTMRAIMVLCENSTPATLQHLSILSTGYSKAPITIASKRALGILTTK